MKFFFNLVLLGSVVATQCNKTNPKPPDCVQHLIAEIKSQPKWNPAGEISEYRYRGELVYLVSSDCCDQFIVLYNGTCEKICAPSGGITGKGDGKCADFYENATKLRLVWKDDR